MLSTTVVVPAVISLGRPWTGPRSAVSPVQGVGEGVFGEAALSSAVNRGGRGGGGAATQTPILCSFGAIDFSKSHHLNGQGLGFSFCFPT